MTATAKTKVSKELKMLVKQSVEAPNRRLEAIQVYLSNLARQTKGELTPEILREIDWLYDVDIPGIRTAMAGTLGLQIHDLQRTLGRERQVACDKCGNLFTVFERRRQGGYTESTRSTCTRCERKERSASRREWIKKEQEAEAKRRYRVEQRIEIEEQILDILEIDRDPLTFPPLRQHVITYALCWMIGEATQFVGSLDWWSRPSSLHLGTGCMVCDREPIGLWVMKEEDTYTITQKSDLWQALEIYADRGVEHFEWGEDLAWPPLFTVYQALWRLSPEQYFTSVPLLPICQLPVALLCADCAKPLSETHTEIELGGVRIEVQDDSVLAEAADVQFVAYKPRMNPNMESRLLQIAAGRHRS